MTLNGNPRLVNGVNGIKELALEGNERDKC
jgi:hypothetical protein